MKTNLANKRILLTGGTGFLGQHVRDSLANRGCRIGMLGEAAAVTYGLDLKRTYVTAPTGNKRESAVWSMRSAEHDLTQPGVAAGICYDLQPHIVVHLAALTGGIGANRSRPADFFYQNLMMGVQTLHASWETGADKFVGVGTICAYPRDTPAPFRETSLWDGYPEDTNAPYGIAKKMLLTQGQAYREQYGFNAVHLMPTNLYGPGDSFDLDTSHVIPALIRKLVVARENDEPSITVWGTGSATREFLYVEDAAEAIVRAIESYDEPEPMNLGTGGEISIKNLVELLVELVGYEGKVIWDHSKPDGQPRRCLDVSKQQNYLGFEPQTELRAGLVNTIQWFQQHVYPTIQGSGKDVERGTGRV